MSSNSRNAGRTHSMLLNAGRLKSIYATRLSIVAANRRHAEQLRDSLNNLGIVGVITGTDRELYFDWNTMEIPYCDSSAIVLVDHYTYETKIADLQHRLAEAIEEIKILRMKNALG